MVNQDMDRPASSPTGNIGSYNDEEAAESSILNGNEKIEGQQPFSDSWPEVVLTSSEVQKAAEVIEACEPRDVARLAALASTHGGFVNDEVRRRAWPIVLGSDTVIDASEDWKQLPRHRDEDQVALDVHRAFVYYPRSESEEKLDHRKEELSNLILASLRPHPDLHYFQGYHDIAQVLLLVLGSTNAAPALTRLSLLRIRDFMLPTMSATNSHLELLPPILYAADPALCKHLSGLQPFFALAATLTLFAHDIEEYGGISRLFDFLLARPAVISVYLFAAIVMIRKDELFEFGADEPEMLYAILSKLPKPLDVEALIEKATILFARFPPESLPFRAWKKVSENSVLKTTRTPSQVRTQTLDQGHTWLKKQSEEIDRAEAWKKFNLKTRRMAKKYQRPAGGVALAVIIGVVSIWLGRNGSNLAGSGVPGLFGWFQHRFLYNIQHALAQWRIT